MAGPLVAPLAIGGALFGGATSAVAAREQNKSIERSMQSQRQAGVIAQKQLADQAGLEQLKAARTAHQIQGRLRVAAGEAGVGMGGSYAALSQQNAFDESLNQAIIEQNFQNEVRNVRSGYQANITALESQFVNPLLQAFTGTFGGFGTGLQIGGAIDAYKRIPDPTDPYQAVRPPQFGLLPGQRPER